MNRSNYSFEVIALALVMFFACSCNQEKKNYINEFENFVVQVEMDYENYSNEYWEQADQRYAYYDGLLPQFQSKMTEAEIQKVANLKVRYSNLKPVSIIDAVIKKVESSKSGEAAKKIIDGGKEIFEGVNDLKEQVAEDVEGIKAFFGVQEDCNDAINDN